MGFSVRLVRLQVLLRLDPKGRLHGEQSVLWSRWFLAVGSSLCGAWITTGGRWHAGDRLCSFGSLFQELIKF